MNEAPQTGDDQQGGFFAFLKENWIWWLAPLILAAGLVVWLVMFSEGDADSPFIYDNF
ncbi:MAG: DUF5989 family protein [Planctomycetota bacterium]